MHAYLSENLAILEKALGYEFKNRSHLTAALTHTSYAHEQQDEEIIDNERLEFLGDAVLELITSEYLFTSYPEHAEAELSRMKAFAVQESTLAESASRLGIGDFLRLGKGEEMTGGRQKPSLLANAFEAVLAAVYLDGGYETSRELALSVLIPYLDKLSQNDFIYDFKSKLQEIAQSEYGVLPRYVLHKQEGPEHEKIFEVKVYVKDTFLGSGRGKTKKSAAQIAAEAGLKKITENKWA